jgi:hypothetical protein
VRTLIVEIIRKSTLPKPEEVIPQLREAAAAAHSIKLRNPGPPGFPLFFSAAFELIEPAIAYLHEHAIQRAHLPTRFVPMRKVSTIGSIRSNRAASRGIRRMPPI